MWIKVCGLRDVATALAVAETGVSAVGLNFCAASPRSIAPDVAREIVAALPPATTPVGVFVNHAVDDVRRIAELTGLRTLQLHGDEPPEMLRGLREFTVIRAVRFGDAEFGEGVRDAWRQWREWDCEPWALLIDAYVPGMYGGTGQTVVWERLHAAWTAWPEVTEGGTRLILAGGLTSQNVAEAIAAVHPFGVDTASGVERAPGVKDLALVRQFVKEAKRAERALP